MDVKQSLGANLKEITIRDSLNVIFRQKAVIFLSICVVMAGVLVGLQLRTPVFQATVKMYIRGQSQTTSDVYRGIGPFRIHLTQMEIVRSNPVLTRSIKALKLDKRPFDYQKQFSKKLKQYLIDRQVKKTKANFDALKPKEKKEFLFRRALHSLKISVKTELIPNTDMFRIVVEDYDAAQAMEIANVISRSYTVFDHQQQLAELQNIYGKLHPAVMQLKDNISKMSRRLHGRPLPDLEAMGTASIKIVEQASSNFQPVGKSKFVFFLSGFFVSIFLGIGLAFGFDFLNTTMKSPKDCQGVLGIPLLGSIPKRKLRDKPLVVDAKKSTVYTQHYEDLAIELFAAMKEQNLRSVLVASALKKKKSSTATIVANLGYCLSEKLGHKTLIIDADMRNIKKNKKRPSVNRVLNLDEGPGLANMLDGEKGEMIHTFEYGLSVLQAGSTEKNPANLLGAFALDKILKQVKEGKKKYDTILIHCSNMSEFKDVSMLAPLVGGVVITVEEGKDRRQVVKNAVGLLRLKDVTLVGSILNNRTYLIPKIIYNRL
ncbi:MAG: hypothetical protein GY754_44530 [bacterium]|nr:hypothetical protein [bacterium]